VLQKQRIEASITLPHKAFNRRIGSFAGARVGFDGRIIGEEEWQANERNWLPTADDRAYVASLMGRVVEPGKFAGWIAPPALGINKQPIDFEYVRFD
jgi:benzoyl-CoA 2,3-dioxygenase component B